MINNKKDILLFLLVCLLFVGCADGEAGRVVEGDLSSPDQSTLTKSQSEGVLGLCSVLGVNTSGTTRTGSIDTVGHFSVSLTSGSWLLGFVDCDGAFSTVLLINDESSFVLDAGAEPVNLGTVEVSGSVASVSGTFDGLREVSAIDSNLNGIPDDYETGLCGDSTDSSDGRESVPATLVLKLSSSTFCGVPAVPGQALYVAGILPFDEQHDVCLMEENGMTRLCVNNGAIRITFAVAGSDETDLDPLSLDESQFLLLEGGDVNDLDQSGVSGDTEVPFSLNYESGLSVDLLPLESLKPCTRYTIEAQWNASDLTTPMGVGFEGVGFISAFATEGVCEEYSGIRS